MSGILVKMLALRLPAVSPNFIHTTSKALAARKGTREKARKKKVKVEVKKIGFIPHNLRNLDKLKIGSRRSVDPSDQEPIDAVFVTRFYKTVTYSVCDAIKCHREVNDPTMYNKPSAPVKVTIELNMVAEKKTRYIDSFNRIVGLPNPFSSYEDRTVLALCKTPEQAKEVMDAGANLAGGIELLNRIQTGSLSLHDFKYVICHPNILPELVPIRGLLKRKFPSAKSGTLGPDLVSILNKFRQGLQYRCEKNADEHDLGTITAQIGSLDMDDKQMEENYAALVRDVESMRPKRGGDFVTWVWCHAEPSPERLKVEFRSYLEESA